MASFVLSAERDLAFEDVEWSVLVVFEALT
jgi:hypothetical protein